MSIDTAFNKNVQSELQQTIDRLVEGVRDPEVGRLAREDMDRMREETQKRIGSVESAIDLIRDARDQRDTSSMPRWPSNGYCP